MKDSAGVGNVLNHMQNSRGIYSEHFFGLELIGWQVQMAFICEAVLDLSACLLQGCRDPCKVPWAWQ